MSGLKARMDHVRYANCWEDPNLLLQGIRPGSGDRVLSICSSGDNALALAASGAGEVVAFDINPAQLACLALRVAALKALDHEALLDFLGALQSPESVKPSDKTRRLDRWRLVRERCDTATRRFWDDRPGDIAVGVVHAGRFERFFAMFRRRLLPLVHRRATVESLFAQRDRASRMSFYDQVWNHRRWRLLFAAAFSRFSLGRFGRDPSFFDHVEGPVAARIAKRTRHALVELAVDDNPWLAYILEGHFQRVLPPWLRPEAVRRLAAHPDGIRTVHGDLGGLAGLGRFQGANLSDIFEYMDPARTTESAGLLSDLLMPGARVAYWNLLAPRSLARSCPGRFQAQDDLARNLHATDRAWFYGAFHLDVFTGAK